MWKRVLFGGALLVAGAVAHQERREAVHERPAPAPAAPDLAAAGARADSLRDGVARALRFASAAGSDSARAQFLSSARGLAREYAAAWSDPFLERRVAHFERASAADRLHIAASDSLWRAGRAAIGQQGVPAALELWRESLRHARAAHDSAGISAATGAIGAGWYSAGELDSAARWLGEAQRLAAAVGDHRTLGNVLGNLASVNKDRGDLTPAAQRYREAMAIRPRSGDTRGLAADLNNLGLVAWSLGDLTEARLAFQRALVLNAVPGRERHAALNHGNLGDLASLEGDYATAQSAYETALRLNRATGDEAERAFVLHDLARLAARRGDYPAAIAALDEALAIHERSGAALEAVGVRSDLAAVEAASGDLERALSTLRRAERDASGNDVSGSIQAGLALALADLDLQFGRLQDADGEYRRAERLYMQAANDAGRAEAQQGRGMLLLMGDDYVGALRLFDLAARGQASAGDRRTAALTRLLAGHAHRMTGDSAASRRTLLAALDSLRVLNDTVGEVAALVGLGALAEGRGAPLEAESLYRRGLGQLGDRAVPDLQWRLHAGLGRSLRVRGDLPKAAEQLRAAVNAVEGVAAGVRLEERRAGFLADKWQVYAALALVEQARGRAAETFAVSERMRGRQMLALLARGRVVSRSRTSEREQDLRRRITELTEEIAGSAPVAGSHREPAAPRRSLAVAREALDAAQKAYAALLADMRESDPAYAAMVAAEPIDWRTAASRLGDDEALVEYLVTDSASSALVVTRDTVAAFDLNADRRQLSALVDFVRDAMGRPDTTAAPLWRAPLHRLYQLLIEPVEESGLLAGKRTIVIVPHGDLHFLPFGALLTDDAGTPFLIERYQLTYAPSASVWLRLQHGAPRRAGRVLALAPHTDRLPASRDELASILAQYPGRATALVGRPASAAALRARASGYAILHLATFGVLNKHNPLFSYVELAGAGDEARLEVHEVFALPLDGQLVVLSACQTALASGAVADVPPGDDWVGLTQAFLQAGARGVLASLWRVEDRATARLMELFYRRLASGESEAAALAGAQRAVLREPGRAHPFYWAGFVLSGSGTN
jgi:CHAT domain-containing protein/tetratricopeptide (TPR) repeat protein